MMCHWNSVFKTFCKSAVISENPVPAVLDQAPSEPLVCLLMLYCSGQINAEDKSWTGDGSDTLL